MDVNTLDEIISGFKNTKTYGRAYISVIKHLRLVRKLRKTVKNQGGFCGFTHNQIKYITENFPKIEEIMLEDTKALAMLKNVRTQRGEPVYYLAFLRYVKEFDGVLDEKRLKEIFDEVNKREKSVLLRDSGNFVLYMRMAVCHEICRFYTDKRLEHKEKSDRRVTNLFISLDEILAFDKEDCINSNSTEKLLLQDRIYAMSTVYTKESIRMNLEALAKKHKISEYDYVSGFVSEKENFTGVLCDKPFGGQVYMMLHIFMTILFTFFLSILSPVFVLSVIPVYRCCKLVLDRFFSRFILKGFTEPALELEKIPHDRGVLVTVTTLITGKENDRVLFERLEKMYHSNGGDNIYFSLLCDLSDSSTQQDEGDRATIKNATDNILRLRKKYGDVFFLFLRDRQYSQKQECFMAPERKRGAVNALCSFLCNKSDMFSCDSIKPDESLCQRIKYVFTLDSDTNLAFDCVRKAAGIMLHPSNSPVFDEEKGRVVGGYGILQPKMQTCLASSNKTAFTSIMCGPGGIDSYSSAGYDLAFALFGRGVFCGKGMFDKECFYRALCRKGEFRNDIVLSHDAPEGAILRCISTSRITLTDGFPREQMSYNKRRHRWVRGDIQNLHFLGKYRLNARGERVVSGVDKVSRYLMLENIVEGLLQIFSLILIFLSLSARDETVCNMLITVALSPYLLPLVYTLLSSLKKAFLHNLRRLFYSKGVYSALWNEILRTFLAISFLPQSAYVCFDGVVRALYRMCISGKNTLGWMTAAQSDRESKDGILGYVKKNLFSTFCAVAVITLSLNSFVRLLGLTWLALPFTAYYTGMKRKHTGIVVSDYKRQMLLENLGDMWKYFEDIVTAETSFLPFDNMAVYPARKVSYMTSPTNIGMYLASAVVAVKAGLISVKNLENICENTLGTLKKIPKYKGLLYNWYDVRDAQPLEPKFVSSVDEGNYIACLYVLLGAVDDYKDEFVDYGKTRGAVAGLIDEADISLLYNKKRKLFYIGLTHEKDGSITFTKNCYDMLMSETRILSYTATSQKKVDSSHFSRLLRPLVESDRYVGLASWSGTVFEYFMPAIFLPTFYGSLSFEALNFALWVNVKNGSEWNGERVFGISESCCNSFDDSGNYMYHAFGNEKIALCVFSREQVISPYSSYLMMESDPDGMMKNLGNLRDMGMYGKYGFYESCDFDRHNAGESYGIVKCFMSHHVGMSICALGNLLFEGCVRKYFLADKRNASGVELLEERIPTEVYIRKRARKYYPMLSKQYIRPVSCDDNTNAHTLENTEKADDEVKITITAGGIMTDCNTCEGKSENCVAEWLTAKREPAKIITVKVPAYEKVCLEVVCKSAEKVLTEAGGVVFYLDGKMCFALGFFFDEGQNVSQCICNADDNEKWGRLFFEGKNQGSEQREYLFAVGYAKSFDSIYDVRKRLLCSKEKIIAEAMDFSNSLEIDIDAMPALLRHGEKKARFVILTKKTPIQAGVIQGINLLYTKSPLKEYAVTGFVGLLWEAEKNICKENLLICALFCGYCTSLEKRELTKFISENTKGYRLVIKYLLEYNIKNNERGENSLYRYCLKQLKGICKAYGDDAACSIVSSVIDTMMDENTQGC